MCLDYEWEYMRIRAEEARKLAKQLEDEFRKPKPAAPAAAPEAKPQDAEPVPV
jgi:hypothetical protein